MYPKVKSKDLCQNLTTIDSEICEIRFMTSSTTVEKALYKRVRQSVSTYFFPVDRCFGFSIVRFRTEKNNSIGAPANEYGPRNIVSTP